MKAARYEDLPAERLCNHCGEVKPREEMIVVFHQKTRTYYCRPKCKQCHNAHERGTRREYKRLYLRRWRRENKAVNDSYRKNNPNAREQSRINAYRYFTNNHDAVLIQGRLRRKGVYVDIREAKRLLETYGPCYPTRHGLTPNGLRECERIRSRLRQRRGSRPLRSFDIRLMVYEDGLFIPPAQQTRPYQKQSEQMRTWQAQRRAEASL